VNDAPTVGDRSFDVDEHADRGTVVGTIVGSDIDAGDWLAYTIVSGNGDGIFAIHPASGRLTVANGTLLDYATAANHRLRVRVTDSGGLIDTATISIQVNVSPERWTPDVPEPEPPAPDVPEPEGGDSDEGSPDVPAPDVRPPDDAPPPEDEPAQVPNGGPPDLDPAAPGSGDDAYADDTGRAVPAGAPSTGIGNAEPGKGISYGTPGDSSAQEADTSAQVVEAGPDAADDATAQQASSDAAPTVPETAAARPATPGSLTPEHALSRYGQAYAARFREQWQELDSPALRQKLDSFNKDVDDRIAAEEVRETITVGTAAGLAVTATAGYVLWCLRGGSLLASMLSSIPLWRWFDPLPILESRDKDERRRKRRRRADCDRDRDEIEKNVQSLMD